MVAILGSGFGLYGYLPALAGNCNQRVVLPERYRNKYAARTELAPFANKIEWHVDETTCLKKANVAVLALRPLEQERWVHHCLKEKHIERILLEKPMARNPNIAKDLYESLIHSGKVFRIGYNFRYTWWAEELREILRLSKSGQRINIHWSFFAHHFQNNINSWKRYNELGGGVIRFYGIHLISLLAEVGYRDVIQSETWGGLPDQPASWKAIFRGENLPEFEIFVDTASQETKFLVSVADLIKVNISQPFEKKHSNLEISQNELDGRIPVLEKLCQSLLNDDLQYEWYGAVLKLWSCVEENLVSTYTKALS